MPNSANVSDGMMIFTYGVLMAILAVMAAIILYRMWTRWELVGLISEPDSGKASLSRFQMLLFTFVVAGLFLLLCIDNGKFVDIPPNVLILIGISSGTYVISKGVKKDPPRNKPDGTPPAKKDDDGNSPTGTA